MPEGVDLSSADLKRAVWQLRKALDKTQTEFGALIGKGLATIQRYETLVPPKGPALVKLAVLAEESGHMPLAAVFRSALTRELGGLRSAIGIGRMQEALLLALDEVKQLRSRLHPRFRDLRAGLTRVENLIEAARAAGDDTRAKLDVELKEGEEE